MFPFGKKNAKKVFTIIIKGYKIFHVSPDFATGTPYE
jgi:hypothetical protein